MPIIVQCFRSYDALRLTVMGLLLFSLDVTAGQLILKNGDHLEGELQSIKKNDIEWVSTTLGEITLPKTDIEQFSTNRRFKFPGYDSECVLHETVSNTVHYQCGQAISSISLLTLKDVVPYLSAATTTNFSRASLVFSGDETSGNNQDSLWSLESEYTKRNNDWRQNRHIRFNSSSEMIVDGDDVKETTNTQLLAQYGLDWFFRPEWFWTLTTEGEQDEKTALKLRYELGMGMGYQFWQTLKSSLSTELGVSFEKERFNDQDDGTPSTENDEYSSLSWIVNFNRNLPRQMRVFYEHDIQSSLQRSTDWKAQLRSGIALPMGYGLSTEFRVHIDYDNTPQEDREKLDRTLSVGIRLQW